VAVWQRAVEGLVTMFNRAYAGQPVLVTGHTGFKGAWLSSWLKDLGAQVFGYGWPPPTEPNLHEIIRPGTFAAEFHGDVRDPSALSRALDQAQPRFLFHLAAQALVRRSYAEPLETFAVNALGTAQILESVRQSGCNCVTVVVTSDKCYDHQGGDVAYRETDPLGGRDVYSMSKGAAELVVQAWRSSFFAPSAALGPLASARAGNVIGGGDYADDRLLPDCIRALLAGQPIDIRNPTFTRPWQHVLDCLSGYLWLGARLADPIDPAPPGAYNFGPGPCRPLTVADVVKRVLEHWPGEWRDASDSGAPRESDRLTLAIDKAAQVLDWRPTWGAEDAIARTVQWYHQRHVAGHADMAGITRQQIHEYCAHARRHGLPWAQPPTP
jgi:CDP-glucose 4,6-dehydratase